MSATEQITGEAVARVADFLVACGFDQNEVARSLVIEGVARGRVAAGSDEWIERLTAITTTLAREVSAGAA